MIARWYYCCLTALLCLGLPTATAAEPSANKAYIVLIIDDIGNNLPLSRRAINLPGAVTFSFLPYSPHGVKLAEEAHQLNKEVMLHLPMSTLRSDYYSTGLGAITPAMDRQMLQQTLSENLRSVPHVKGVNNHMGSLLTQLNQPMNWLMQALKEQGLYFVDSRTSPLTVAEKSARQHQVPVLRRDVFLDNLRENAAINERFEKLLSLAQTNRLAVAIAHPHPETLDYLEQALPSLAAIDGVELISASTALAKFASLLQPK